MAYIAKGLKEDLCILCRELGISTNPDFRIVDYKNAILKSDNYDEGFCRELLSTIINERNAKRDEDERRRKSEFEFKKLQIMRKRSNYVLENSNTEVGSRLPNREGKQNKHSSMFDRINENQETSNINAAHIPFAMFTERHITKEIKLNNRNVVAIVKTGSSVSLLREDVCGEIPYVSNKGVVLEGIGNSWISTMGSIQQEVIIDENNFTLIWHVVPTAKLQFQAVIGADILGQASMNFVNNNVEFCKYETKTCSKQAFKLNLGNEVKLSHTSDTLVKNKPTDLISSCNSVVTNGNKIEDLAEGKFGITRGDKVELLSLEDKHGFPQKEDVVQFQKGVAKDECAVNVKAVRAKIHGIVDTIKGNFGFLSYEAEEGEKLLLPKSVKNDVKVQSGDKVENNVILRKRTEKYAARNVVKIGDGRKHQQYEGLRRSRGVSVGGIPRLTHIQQPKGYDRSTGFKLRGSKYRDPNHSKERFRGRKENSKRIRGIRRHFKEGEDPPDPFMQKFD